MLGLVLEKKSTRESAIGVDKILAKYKFTLVISDKLINCKENKYSSLLKYIVKKSSKISQGMFPKEGFINLSGFISTIQCTIESILSVHTRKSLPKTLEAVLTTQRLGSN